MLKGWFPFLINRSNEKTFVSCCRRQNDFCRQLVEQLIPDFADGYSGLAVNKLFRHFFSVFNRHNIYFVLYYRSFGAFRVDELPSQPNLEHRPSKIERRQNSPTPFKLENHVIWCALDVNDPEGEHMNKVQFVPNGSIPHHIAEEVRQNDSHAAFSAGIHFFFHRGCRAAFFKVILA
ncbi:hypothetical protein GEMRC1_004016 [Eukaryota sp. GEM-RC1]